MPASFPHILVTGANGQLGTLVLEEMVRRMPPTEIAGLVRDAGGPKSDRLRAMGVQLRVADYESPETLAAAFKGIKGLLFISSIASERRVSQHRNVIEAAVAAGVKLVAYTSVLHADASPLGVAGDHRETEAMLHASGLPFVILRHGWYTENYTAALPAALAHGALFGAAGSGRIASAARADYAAAATAVLTSRENLAGRVFELAGDTAYTLGDLAAELSSQAGQKIAYVNLPQIEYERALLEAGLPPELAALIANSDAGAAQGALFDAGRQLSGLIGRPTTPLATSVTQALEAQAAGGNPPGGVE